MSQFWEISVSDGRTQGTYSYVQRLETSKTGNVFSVYGVMYYFVKKYSLKKLFLTIQLVILLTVLTRSFFNYITGYITQTVLTRSFFNYIAGYITQTVLTRSFFKYIAGYITPTVLTRSFFNYVAGYITQTVKY